MPGWRLHQLEILLVLRGGARRDLVEKLTGMTRVGAAEFGEGSEEMVVARYGLGGDEAAHGKGIDQLVVKSLVLERFRGWNVAGLADRLGLGSGLDRLRLREPLRHSVYAELVIGADADERLGVDRAIQMIVQIGALRHALQEVAQSERVVADSFELLHRALGGCGLHLLRHIRGGGRCQERNDACPEASSCYGKDSKDTHGPLPR